MFVFRMVHFINSVQVVAIVLTRFILQDNIDHFSGRVTRVKIGCPVMLFLRVGDD